MSQDKIVPSLWFNTEGGSIEKVISYYKNVFGENFQSGSIMPLGNTPSGNTEMCEVSIFEKKYNLMSTAVKHHPFNDAMAFTINCEDQNEIDKYWNYFTKEGQEVQCGWCNDKFGLRWQVLPKNFGTLMSKPNSFKIMMNQKKIIIEEYLK
jgi:predicted 3-demethylubiquinone-9 3-methyltransferase (glyoxalase superfamily)